MQMLFYIELVTKIMMELQSSIMNVMWIIKQNKTV